MRTPPSSPFSLAPVAAILLLLAGTTLLFLYLKPEKPGVPPALASRPGVSSTLR